MREVTPLRIYYRELGDDAIVAAFREGESQYQPAAWSVIVEEMQRRSLPMTEPEPATSAGPQLPREELERLIAEYERQAGVGFFIVMAGLALTFGTWLLTKPGGTYVVAWGAMLFGTLRVVVAKSRAATLRETLKRAPEPGN